VDGDLVNLVDPAGTNGVSDFFTKNRPARSAGRYIQGFSGGFIGGIKYGPPAAGLVFAAGTAACDIVDPATSFLCGIAAAQKVAQSFPGSEAIE